MKIRVTVGRLVWLILSFVGGLISAHGATLYVSTQGSDSNPGTAAQPFRTITHAYSAASAGTTILVAPGVYTDYTSGWGIHLGKSGTASSPIILQSQVPGGAIIDGQNASDRNLGIYIDGNYNVVDGFEIKGGPKGGISLYLPGGSYNQIRNCNIHNNGNPAGSSGDGQCGIYSSQGTSSTPSTQGNVYSANYIHDNGRTGSNLDHGLYLCGNNEVVINNVVVANATHGLQIAGYTTVNNMKVCNNVFAYNGKNGIILWQALNGVDIQNNILYKNGHAGVGSWDAHGSGVVMDHNLSYGNMLGDFNLTDGGSDFSYSLAATIYADPKLVDETTSGFDAHLGNGSPCIQAAVNLSSSFTTDIAGSTRPAAGAWDLGAYMFGVVVTSLRPTLSLTKVAEGAMSLTWDSIAGKIYRVAYKGNLTDSWTDLSGDITAAGTSTSWTDSSAATAIQRFYMVYTN